MRTVLPFLLVQVLAAGEVAPAVGATFAERVAANPLNRPAEEATLVLPTLSAAGRLQPRQLAAGATAVGRPGFRQAPWVWARPSWTEAHGEFLTRWAEAGDDETKRFAVAAWCKAKKLPACQEWVLRQIMQARFAQLGNASYQRALAAWTPLAKERPAPYAVDLPVTGEWLVAKDTTGHHAIKHGAAFAVDLVITKNGKPFKGQGRQLAEHYAWDQPVLACADGVVTYAITGHPDNPIGKLTRYDQANTVIVDHGGGLKLIYAHLKQDSCPLKVGDQVARGQELGRAGNSGASGAPHLHITACDWDHVSVPGRFRFEVKKGTRWVAVEDSPLPEGSLVRPLAAADQAPGAP